MVLQRRVWGGGAVPAGEARRLYAVLLDAGHDRGERRRDLCRQRIASRAPQVRDIAQLRVGHIAEQVRLRMRVVDAVDDDLAPAGIGHDVALGYLENRRAPEVARSHVWVARGGGIQPPAEMRPPALADDQDRAPGGPAPN